MNYNVVINTDDNYIQHCMAMLCSLFENNKEHYITVHVLMRDLSDFSKKKIADLAAKYSNKCEFYRVDESPLDGVQFRKQRPLSKAAYYRLLLSSVLPQDIDKVLYLDCDIIVLRDLSEIFSIELEDYALAATLDNSPYTNQHRLQLQMEADERSFCSGIMLVNLDYWRKHDSESMLLEYARRYRKEVYLHDQDVLNYLFKKRWFLLPPKWNRVAYIHICRAYTGYKTFDYKEYREKPMLIHFAAVGLKPWLCVYTPFKGVYMKYLRLSGFSPITFKQVSMKRRLQIYKYDITYYIRELLHLWS